MVFLGFPLFSGHAAVLGSCNPHSPFVLFDPQIGPFEIQKALHETGQMSNLSDQYSRD